MISSAANSVQRRTARQHERSRWLTRFLPIALVLGLLGGGLGATLDALPAAASTVSGVLFSGSSHIAGETGTTWTVAFTATTAVPNDGSITVTFPSEFDLLGNPSITVPPFTGTCAGIAYTVTTVPGEQSVNINLGAGCSLTAGTSATVTFPDVTNPPANVYTNTLFEVSTSADTTAVPNPSNVTITGATTGVYAVSFSGSSYGAGVTGTTWTVDFTTSTHLAAGDEIEVTFPAGFVVPTGTVVLGPGFAAADCTYSSAASSGSSVLIVLANSGGTCSLPAESLTLQITGITNPAAATYDNTLFSVSTTFDSAGSPAGDVVIGSGGGVVTPPANTVYGVTFSGSSMSGGATNTTWTVGFTTSDPNGELVPGDHIDVTFPAGFVIPLNPAVTLGSGFFGCTATPQATAVASGTTVLITLGAGCELDASTSATLSIAGITNPAAGTYANTSFSVSTSVDFEASPAAAVVIIGATITSTCLGSTGNAAFLCLAYEDLLGRAPDAGGLATFEGLLAAGVSRGQVAYDIATSPERHSDVVQFYYDALLGRPADPGGLASWVGVLNAGWSDQQVLEGIMGSAEFYGHVGGTPSAFVTALYADLLGRGPDAGGLASWVGAVNAGVSRGAVVAGFLYSNEGEARFVEGEYTSLLDRPADPGGLATWVSVLAHGASYEQVIAGIMGSPEFYALSQ